VSPMDLFKIVYPRLCVGPMPLTGGNSRHFQLPDVDGDKQEEFAVISRCSTWELLVVIQPGTALSVAPVSFSHLTLQQILDGSEAS
jgi:hypothetical protein